MGGRCRGEYVWGGCYLYVLRGVRRCEGEMRCVHWRGQGVEVYKGGVRCTVPSTHKFTRARLARDSIECNNDSCALTQSKTAGPKIFTINSLKLT